MKEFFKKIAPIKKVVLINAALEDEKIAKKFEWLLMKKFIGSILIKNLGFFETNENLQNAKIIIIFYNIAYNNVPSIWIEESLRFWIKAHLSFVKQPLKFLVCTTREKKAEVEKKYITGIKKLKIEVVELNEEQDFKNLLLIVKNNLNS
jgi:hypothetical protein